MYSLGNDIREWLGDLKKKIFSAHITNLVSFYEISAI